jgi:serine O-acetyltransferase
MVGAGAILLGPINVGNNARIAANAVVRKDVPADAIVFDEDVHVFSKKEKKGV